MFEATAIVHDLAVCSLITAESAIWKSALQYFHFRFFNFPFGKGKSLAFYHVFLRFDMRFLSRSLAAKSRWKVFFSTRQTRKMYIRLCLRDRIDRTGRNSGLLGEGVTFVMQELYTKKRSSNWSSVVFFLGGRIYSKVHRCDERKM